MIKRSDLVIAALAVTAAAGVSLGARAGGAGPVVIHDVRASTDPYGLTATPNSDPTLAEQPNTEVEPSVAANPADSDNVVTAFQETRVDAGGDRDNGFAASFDGGATWTYGNLPGLTKASSPSCSSSSPPPGCAFDRASDAVVAFGKDPTGKAFHGYFVYVSSLVFDDTSQNALPSGMAVNVSSDGGKTWGNAVILEQDNIGGLNDKNWIVADNGSGSGHHPGRVYVVWDREAPVVYAYCDPDGSATAINGTGCDKLGNWSNANGNGFYTLYPGQGIGTMPVVLNDGSLGIMFSSLTTQPCTVPPSDQPNCGTPGSSNIVWEYIPAAGTTVWPAPLADPQAPVTIATYESNGITRQRAGSLPQVAVDPTGDDVYVVWEDNRFRTDGGATPGASDSSNQNDPVIAISTPGPGGVVGLSWTGPIRIDSAAPTGDYVDRYNTTVAVGSDGIVRIAYRQRYEGTGFNVTTGIGTAPIDTYYQESRDGGHSFSAPLKVDTTQATTDVTYGAFSRFSSGGGLFEGDYEQIAAAGPDESYVTRDEAWNPSPASQGPCPTGFTTAKPCQNQQTFVAQIEPAAPAGSTPESRFVPALLVVGAAAAVVAWRRKRQPVA